MPNDVIVQIVQEPGVRVDIYGEQSDIEFIEVLIPGETGQTGQTGPRGFQGVPGTSGAGTATVVRTPEQYGALGDGIADDQTALVNMLAATLAGETLRLAGRYRHSGVLTLNVANVLIDGRGGELFAINRNTAAFRFPVGASGVRVVGLRHVVAPYNGTDNAGNGRGTDDSSTTPFYMNGCNDWVLQDVYSANSAQTGIFMLNCARYQLLRPTVMRSYADGIHQTHNCRDGFIDSPVVWFPGDDGVAIVSYRFRDAVLVDPCARIFIRKPFVRHCHARGVTVVGGNDIVVTDVDIEFTRAAGLMIAAEQSYDTHTPQRVAFRGGRVSHVGYPVISSQGTIDAGLDHGALFLFNAKAGTNMADCRFSDITVSDLAQPLLFTYARSILEGTATFSGCGHDRITIAPGPGPAGLAEGRAGVTTTATIDLRPAAAGASTGLVPSIGGRRALAATVNAVGAGVTPIPMTANVADKGSTFGSFMQGTRGIKIPATMPAAVVYDVTAAMNGKGSVGIVDLIVQIQPPTPASGVVPAAVTILEVNQSGNNDARVGGTTPVAMNPGDEVIALVYLSGAAGTIASGNGATWLSVFVRGT